MPAAVYYKLNEDVSPLPDHILVHNMEQGDKLTKGGILIPDDNGKDRGIRARWCQVYKVGTKIDYVAPGEWILVEHGRWTFGVDVTFEKDGEESTLYLQRVDTDAVMAASPEKPDWI